MRPGSEERNITHIPHCDGEDETPVSFFCKECGMKLQADIIWYGYQADIKVQPCGECFNKMHGGIDCDEND